MAFFRWLMASYAFIAIIYQGGASCITLAGRTYLNLLASAPSGFQHDQLLPREMATNSVTA